MATSKKLVLGATSLPSRSEKLDEVRRTVSDCFAYYTWTESVKPSLIQRTSAYFPSVQEQISIERSTRIFSLLALRRLNEFLSEKVKRVPDDLRWSDLDLDRRAIIEPGDELLTDEERETINKCVSHLTSRLWYRDKDEVHLAIILSRSTSIFARLKAELDRVSSEMEKEEWT